MQPTAPELEILKLLWQMQPRTARELHDEIEKLFEHNIFDNETKDILRETLSKIQIFENDLLKETVIVLENEVGKIEERPHRIRWEIIRDAIDKIKQDLSSLVAIIQSIERTFPN